jgi:preprotein translocase subunit SecA
VFLQKAAPSILFPQTELTYQMMRIMMKESQTFVRGLKSIARTYSSLTRITLGSLVKSIVINKLVLTVHLYRLDKYMSETSKVYYKEEARRIKKDYIKSTISKYVQQVLTVRHHCKIALYAEFRKDQRTALKYYQSSYIQLRELFVNEMKNLDKVKLIEFKVVADYLNLQICKLYLLNNNLSEAVNQFQKQIRSYMPNVVLPQLEFEHWGWIARQYQVFAQLIEVLLASSVPTFNKYSSQHPSYYYQATVKYLVERKAYAKKLCEPMRKSATGMSMVDKYSKESLDSYKSLQMDIGSQTYLGQPSLNQLNHPLDAIDTNKSATLIEEILITKGIAKELSIPHSSLIIEILNKCYDHFKSTTSNRMILYLAFQIAQEYYNAELYEMSLK